MAEPILVALAFDRGYLPWAGTLLESLLEHHPPGSVEVVVLHDGSLAGPDTDVIRRLAGGREAGLAFLAPDGDRYAPLPTTAEFGPIVWLRLLLPELLPDRRRVLYLDADTHVRAPLVDLWNEDLGGLPLGAVANVVAPHMRPHLQQLGLRYPGGVLNSGVLLLDLEVMRRDRSVQAMFGYAAAHAGQIVWPDQDVLNGVFAGAWKPLHPRWNAQNSLYSWPQWTDEVFGPVLAEEARRRPSIRHFEGPGLAKPWHFLCYFPGVAEYRATQARTPWAGLPPEDRTPMTRVIARLPEHRRIPAYLRLTSWRRRRRP